MPPAQSRGSQFYSEWSKFGVSDTFERVASTFGGQGSSKMMRPSTAQGELKTIALFLVSMDQIIGLTMGSNGRWCPKIRSMNLVWIRVPDAGADRTLSIEDMVWTARGGRYQPRSVGRSIKAREPPGRFARAGAGLPAVRKKDMAHIFERLPASVKRRRVLDNTAGSPPASWGLPGHVRS
jgi:hypothetical protein